MKLRNGYKLNITLKFLSENSFDRLYTKTKDSKLNSDLTRFHRKIHQINLIIGRIIENTNAHRKLNDLIWDENKNSKERTQAIHEHGVLSSYIDLDTEDYFIHIQILMDKIATIIARCSDELPGDKITSFLELIRYLKTNSFQNKTLQLILDQEKWFVLLINVHRNNLVIHDSISEMSGTSYSNNTLNRPIRLVFPNKENSKWILDSLNKIKTNHHFDIPEAQDEENIWKLLLIYDYNAERLSSKEVKEIKKIHKTHGGELPEINIINKKIQLFLESLSHSFSIIPKHID